MLEASADETLALTHLLVELIQNGKHPKPLHEFALARGKDKRITDQISEELVNTFITGLEREDIETLSYSMYRICKVIEKFAERFNLAPDRLVGVDFSRQVELMQRATETLADMVRLLRKMPPLETVKEMNDRLQSIESAADDVMLELLREAYGGKFKPLQAMMVRLQPVNGFAAESSSAVMIGLASHFGIPVSTTHTVSAAIMGVGAAKRFGALKWTIVERMAWAWLLTIPVSAAIGFWLMRAVQLLGYAE